MKKIIFYTISLLLFQFTSQAQENFEGIIKFKSEFVDKTGEVPKEQIKKLMGDENVFFLKEEKYKSEMNGLLNMKSFYNGSDTLFVKMYGTKSLMYELITKKEEEKVLSHEFTKITKKIAGIDCKLLIVKTNKGVHKYYYSDDVKIDPKYYKNHSLGLWNYFMKITKGGISIKHVSDLKDSYSSIEAVSIERKKLDEAIFNRPNLPIIKMPDK